MQLHPSRTHECLLSMGWSQALRHGIPLWYRGLLQLFDPKDNCFRSLICHLLVSTSLVWNEKRKIPFQLIGRLLPRKETVINYSSIFAL